MTDARNLLLQLIYGILITTILLPLSSIAAERISLQHLSLADLQRVMQVSLPDGLSVSTKTQLGQHNSHSFNALRLISQHIDAKRVKHMRLRQEYRGFRVFGGEVMIHRQGKQWVSLNGTIYRGLDDELGEPPQRFAKQSQLVLEQFIARYRGQHLSEKQVFPLIYIDEMHHAYWAYQVSVLVQQDDTMLSRPSAIIDAVSGIYLEQWDDLKTIRIKAKGIGFGGNQRVGRYQFGTDRPLLDIMRDEFLKLCYLENKQVRVVDMQFRSDHSGLPMVFNCAENSAVDDYWTGYEENGYDLQNGAYSPSNDALYIGGIIKQMYRQEYGVEALGSHQHPKQLIMRVHYGKRYANAFWDGRQMTFGDGDDVLYPLVSLGIGAHEVSHGFTEQYANLVYFGQSGGINEAFSDMAAQAAEYYATGKSSWLIGAEILKSEGPIVALRFMDRPSRDGLSIDSAKQYQKGLDVHYSSGVYNRLAYLLANRPGWDPSKVFRIMVKANMDYWTPRINFVEGACGILSATQDLQYEVVDVKAMLDVVGIDAGGC